MITNLSGIPAGYGYFDVTSTPGENIVPNIITHLKESDANTKLFYIQSIAIQVDADTKVSINNKAKILVKKDIGLSFDVRGGITSIVFDTAVNFNIALSY